MKGRNVRPITDLKNRTKELVQEVSDSGETVVITQNGTPRVVVMDIRQHDQLQDTLAMLKLLAQSQDSLAKGEKTYSTAEVRKRARAVLQRSREQ
ncbi:MAG: type II toxin-antitoxin system Phd/YefM family antitoxin [Vicinamibacterales bacterium]|nr:type II toxin-antitoxin system Phd/YefM family antitoxin [Vicinamibacterales bacterium]